MELVKALVEKGADVHAKDKYGYGRPLHRWQSTLHLIRMVRCGHMLLCRRTALHLASERGHTETVKALLRVGTRTADVHAKDFQGYGRPLHRGQRVLALDSHDAMRALAGCAGGPRCTMPQEEATRRRLTVW